MLRLRWTIGAALLVALAPGQAHAAEGVEFLDTRPVVVDLDQARVGQQWRVRVLDQQSGGEHQLRLHVVFQPAGVVTVEGPSVRRASQGQVVDFGIELRRLVEGAGELVVVSSGSVARRAISTMPDAGLGSVEVGSLQFTGIRLVPFTGAVRVAGLSVRDAPGRNDPSGRAGAARRIGVLTSARGDVAEVVRRGDDFFVQGADDVGEYAGSLDLSPQRDGGEATATLRVRDLPAWPLLVLMLGLAVVQTLDRYQRRLRPRRLLELRLARLRDKARVAERETGMALRICALPGDPGLLLDKLVAEALAAAEQHLTDDELAAWEPDGAEWQRLSGVLESFRQLVESFKELRAESQPLDWWEPMDADALRWALDHSAVGATLGGRRIESSAELADSSTELAAARAYVKDLRRIYRTLVRVRATGMPDVRAEALRLLAKLFQSPDDLSGVDAEAADLVRRWQPPVRAAPAYPMDVSAPSPPAGRPSLAAAPRKRSHRLLPAAAAAGLVMAASVLVLSLGTSVDLMGRGGTPTSRPSASPSTRPSPTSIPPVLAALPEAPVAGPPQAPVASGFEARQPEVGQVVWVGVVLPLLVAGVLAAVGWRLLRSWHRRRPPQGIADLDTAAIDRDLRAENLRFSLASGALVVLSGMSLLYASNPTFGSAGDYLAVALWGTAVGEGLHLARRLLPFPSTP